MLPLVLCSVNLGKMVKLNIQFRPCQESYPRLNPIVELFAVAYALFKLREYVLDRGFEVLTDKVTVNNSLAKRNQILGCIVGVLVCNNLISSCFWS